MKMDPQKSANEVIAALAHKMKLKGRTLWHFVGYLADSLDKSQQGEEIVDVWSGSPPEAKRTSRRMKADLFKKAAILKDIAEQHNKLEHYAEEPQEEKNSLLADR